VKITGKIICVLQYKQASEKKRKLLRIDYPKLAEYLEIQKENGGLHHDFSGFKLYELSEFLYVHKPKTILELGGGSTTSAFVDYALRMKDSGVKVKIISVDESEFFLNQTKMTLKKMYPIDNIDLNFVKSDRQEDSDGCFYRDIVNITSKLGYRSSLRRWSVGTKWDTM